MARFGLIYEADEDDDTTGGIWAENVEALVAFLSVATQWRIACPGDGTMRRTGLDYPAARTGLELAGVAVTPELWADIKIIEYAVIAADSEEALRWR